MSPTRTATTRCTRLNIGHVVTTVVRDWFEFPERVVTSRWLEGSCSTSSASAGSPSLRNLEPSNQSHRNCSSVGLLFLFITETAGDSFLFLIETAGTLFLFLTENAGTLSFSHRDCRDSFFFLFSQRLQGPFLLFSHRDCM